MKKVEKVIIKLIENFNSYKLKHSKFCLFLVKHAVTKSIYIITLEVINLLKRI